MADWREDFVVLRVQALAARHTGGVADPAARDRGRAPGAGLADTSVTLKSSASCALGARR